MGLLQQLEETILNKLASLFEPVLSPIKKIWSGLKNFFTALIDLVPESISLFKLVLSEIDAWKNFKKGISFKTGVVSLQSARDRIQQLIDEIISAWKAIIGLWKGAKLNPVEQINEAAEGLAELIEQFGKLGKLSEFLKGILPKIEKVGGKVFEVLAIVQQIAEILLDSVRKLNDIVTAIKDVRETFETGEGLFLSQKNPRKQITLDDGTKMRIRVGGLHNP